MSVPLGEVHLQHPGGTIVLTRANVPEASRDYDVAAFRAPFGRRWHRLGTGQRRPSLLRVTGVIEDADPAAAIAARDAALAALPNVTRVDVGDWQIAVAGAAGGVPVTRTDRGYRLTAHLVEALEAWQAAP